MVNVFVYRGAIENRLRTRAAFINIFTIVID